MKLVSATVRVSNVNEEELCEMRMLSHDPAGTPILLGPLVIGRGVIAKLQHVESDENPLYEVSFNILADQSSVKTKRR